MAGAPFVVDGPAAHLQDEPSAQRLGVRPRMATVLRFLSASLTGVVGVALVTYFGFTLHASSSVAGYLYLLIVVTVAIFSGFWEATVTSLVAATCLNFFFVPPILSFQVAETEDWFALTAFEITALVVSRLSTRVRLQAHIAIRQRRNTEQLYQLSRRILFLDRRQTVGPRLVCLIREAIEAEGVALFDATAARTDATESCSPELEEMARNAYLQAADHSDENRGLCQRALRLGTDLLGGLALSGRDLEKLTVDAVASLTAIALERARSFDKESRAEAGRQTEQLRTAVLDSLAHAFKTPLTAIRTASSGLLEMGNLDPDGAELVSLIDEQSRHLNQLTSDLLQMARIDAANVKISREWILVPEMIQEILWKNREQLRDHSFEVSTPDDGPVAWGDRALVATALLQLFDNAAKYSPPGSVITVSAGEEDAEVIVSVHNNGPPIQMSDRERIFERFYRTTESKHRAPGTGLGLSIVKRPRRRITGAYGLSVRTALGRPSTLPCPGPPGEKMTPPQARILIVDDEASIRCALRTTLHAMRFDVAEASTGEAAVEIIRGANYDVVLLDVNMPGMGGVNACREIRRLKPAMGILMLTVRDGEDDKIEALDAGADDYVTKPFHVRELAARIRAAVRRAHAPQTESGAVIRIGNIELDPQRHVVRRAGENVHVTPKEFELLHLLMSHPGVPITHTRLLRSVWGPEYGGELEYLRTFIRQLRKKLEDDPSEPVYLRTESHIGYRFADAASGAPLD